MIVLDHHTAEAALPAAHAVVNPNRLDDTSGLGQLAAVGVTFMTVVALNRELRRRGHYRDRPEPDLMQWLDLVALGTICDSVPLTGLNRALAQQGFKVMAGRSNTGLAALGDVARLKESPGAYHCGFVLGPRINAGGRVGEPDLGVRLLTTEDKDEAVGLALRLDAYNLERQEIEKAVLADALARAEAQVGKNCIVVAAEGWHPGVIGIVASRVVERFNRPVFVIALADGQGKGSGRSVAGVDLGAAVTAARQAGLLVNGGGHPMAAGLTVAAERLEANSPGSSTSGWQARLPHAPTCPRSAWTARSRSARRRWSCVAAVERIGPFGVGNAEPRFAVMGARIVQADVVGTDHVAASWPGARARD